MMYESGVLSGCSDASTNSSAELLDMEIDDKIAPIFEEDLNDNDDDVDLEEEEEECEENEDDNDDDDDGEECIEIDVEHDDSDFCGTSRKSTYSVKSSVSRYDKLLTLTAPKPPSLMPTSLSFNDNSNATNTKLQQMRQNQQLKEQQKVQRWRGKFKTTDKKETSTKFDENDKTHAAATAGGSQKNIVKRALLSLASGGGGGGGGNNTRGGGGTRPKSTSSLKFGNNKLHLLSGRNKNKEKLSANINQETTAVVDSSAATISVTTTTTTSTTTKSNLGNIITSLLRTTTL